MATTIPTYDVIVVGGGLAGTALALSLVQAGFSCALIERAPVLSKQTATSDLRVSAINLGVAKFLKSIGMWDKIDLTNISEFTAMCVWDALGCGEISFDSLALGQARLGYILENQVMLRALYQSLTQYDDWKGYYHQAPDQLDITRDQVRLTLADQQVIQGKLIIGADGRQSWVRTQAHLQAHCQAYDQHALVATISSAMTHQQTAWQRFLPKGPLACLPLVHAHQSSIVWSSTPAHIQELLALDPSAFNQALSDAFAGRLGDMAVLSQRVSFPLMRLHAPHYVGHRVALIGDAAHTIHPLAGQGANLGLLDAACLAQTLTQTRMRRRDIGGLDTLRRYARARRLHNALMLHMMDGFKRLFTTRATPMVKLRSFGLDFTHRMPWLKQQLMRYAVYGQSAS